jgi:hypothetical protein
MDPLVMEAAYGEQIEALEAENAALWAFVRASDAEWAASADERQATFINAAIAREALRQFEDKP